MTAELARTDDHWGCLQRIVDGMEGLWAKSLGKGSKQSLLCPRG